MMNDDAKKELDEALKADQEKVLGLIAAMDKLHKETWGEPSKEE